MGFLRNNGEEDSAGRTGIQRLASAGGETVSRGIPAEGDSQEGLASEALTGYGGGCAGRLRRRMMESVGYVRTCLHCRGVIWIVSEAGARNECGGLVVGGHG